VKLPPLVADQLHCDRLLYVPARMNPLKNGEPTTDAAHRVSMLAIALADNPDAEISTVELDRVAGGPSYTIDTLRQLRDTCGPQTELVLLIGADQALDFHRWKDWQQILELAEPAVLLRPPWDGERFARELHQRFDDEEAAQWMARVVHVPMIDINATEIRRRLAEGATVDGVIDPAVLQYIQKHGLYKAGARVR
jgi:nicotinate-nucleotide adenylyltransferase